MLCNIKKNQPLLAAGFDFLPDVQYDKENI